MLETVIYLDADDANATGQQKITAAKAKNAGVLLDINVIDAWRAGFTGKGIVQSVSDDGFAFTAYSDCVGCSAV